MGRECKIGLLVLRTLPSYHVHHLQACVTSVVRSARTLPLVPTTCIQLWTLDTSVTMIMMFAANFGCCAAVFASIIVVRLPKKRYWDGDPTSGELGEALLLLADSAHLPTRDLEQASSPRRCFFFSAASALIGLADAFEYVQFSNL